MLTSFMGFLRSLGQYDMQPHPAVGRSLFWALTIFSKFTPVAPRSSVSQVEQSRIETKSNKGQLRHMQLKLGFPTLAPKMRGKTREQ